MDQDRIVEKIGDNIGAAPAGVGMLLIEMVAALAMQTWFDRDRFIATPKQLAGWRDNADCGHREKAWLDANGSCAPVWHHAAQNQ